MDGRLYLEVNHFAKDTPALHGFMVLFSSYLGLVLIVAMLAIAFWRGYRNERISHPYLLLWGVGSAAIGLGITTVLERVIDRVPPYVGRSGVELLVARHLTSSMPNVRAAVVGALVISLYLARQWLLAGIATVLGILVGYGCVYIGASYPGDVLAGAGFGIAISLLGVAALYLVAPLTAQRLDRLPAAPLTSERLVGVAASPPSPAPSGSVRLLSDAPLRPQGAASLQPASHIMRSS